jgi:hypothetical protein
MVELKVELREGKDEEDDKVGGTDKVGTIVVASVVSTGGMEEVVAVNDASEGLAAGGVASEVAETGSSGEMEVSVAADKVVAASAESEVSDTALKLVSMVDPVSASIKLVCGSDAKVCVSMIAPEPSMTWTTEMVCTTSVMVGSPVSRSAVSFSSWRLWNWACERRWLTPRPCK